MKKTLAIALAALAAISSAVAKPFVPGKTAVVTIMANDKISWYGEEDKEGTGIVNLAVRKGITDSGSKEDQIMAGHTAYMMEDVKAAVFEVFAEKGIEIIPEEEVLSSEAYTAATDSKFLQAAFMQKPKGYKLLGTNEKKVYPVIIPELGANNLALISFNIQKNMVNGVGHNGSMKACASVTIQFLDEKAKMAKSLSGYASASNAIPVVKGVYDPKALAEGYPEALRAALRKALSKI